MASARPLLLVGAGGFARETAEAVRAAGGHDLLGYLDDAPARHGTIVDGLAVIGPLDALADHPDAAVIVCTGRPGDYGSRRRLVRRLALPADRYATVVHPAASVAATARVGAGTVLLAGVVLTAAVTVGDHVAVMPGTVLTHDDVVADFVTVAAGVRLGGGVSVDEGAYLGTSALVREGLRVGAWSLVGMGSLVTKDVPAGQVWYGQPARWARQAADPDRAPR